MTKPFIISELKSLHIPEDAVYVGKCQAALLIGMTPSWLDKQVALGRIDPYRVSARKLLFLRADVLDLVAQTKRAS